MHGAQGLRRRQAVQAARGHPAFDLLLQPGHAHLEELVQIGAGDAEELEAFQERIAGVARLIQHALIKLQPAQLAIDEMGRLKMLDCVWHRRVEIDRANAV